VVPELQTRRAAKLVSSTAVTIREQGKKKALRSRRRADAVWYSSEYLPSLGHISVKTTENHLARTGQVGLGVSLIHNVLMIFDKLLLCLGQDKM
jgi:hypothetical protein